ncbi:MAG: enoyl-CoA hydratase [Rhodospirillaceae bacterium]
MTEEPYVLRDDAAGVATLTLNRAQSRNSLGLPMLTALKEALDGVAVDPAARVVVIGGAGPAFCAGHDLREMSTELFDAVYAHKLFTLCGDVMQAIVRMKKPVIARVHGVATAAGCQLVASCDLAVAAEGSRFATPGVNIGLFCTTPMVALTRAIAPKHALQLLLTGDLIDAPTALRIGLINEIVPETELDSRIDALARKLASKSPVTLAMGKSAFQAQRDLPLTEAYAYAAGVMTENLQTMDAQEGICAFLQKRTPEWTGR